ncbi:MAG: TetR/AcrR family transcriptional regulator [Firmicutes bacterium]|nr:TetR/AcrR family transcriptional regulator [Bacillota bacterium]
MPPVKKVSRERIIAAGVAVVRREGLAGLNARTLASELGCSTQPIFSNFASMEELKVEVIRQGMALYHQYLAQEMGSGQYPPYKAGGMGYIRFAKEEKELFKLLFMRDRSREVVGDDRDEIAELIELVQANTGANQEQAYLFHLEMWLYVHGIASMIATSYLEWDWEMISRMLSDAYQGMKGRLE